MHGGLFLCRCILDGYSLAIATGVPNVICQRWTGAPPPPLDPLDQHRGASACARRCSPPGGGAPVQIIPRGKANERRYEHGGSTDRFVLRLPTLANHVARPVVHEAASALEQVGAPVGRLDLPADLVCQRGLGHFARMIGLLGRSVPKARPEAVRHGRDLQRLEQFRHRRTPGRLSDDARKHRRVAPNQRPRLIEDLHGAPAQRDPVLAIRLRA